MAAEHGMFSVNNYRQGCDGCGEGGEACSCSSALLLFQQLDQDIAVTAMGRTPAPQHSALQLRQSGHELWLSPYPLLILIDATVPAILRDGEGVTPWTVLGRLASTHRATDVCVERGALAMDYEGVTHAFRAFHSSTNDRRCVPTMNALMSVRVATSCGWAIILALQSHPS
jgi:hypothetical protein